MLTETEALKKWCPFSRTYRQVTKETENVADKSFVVGVPAFNRKPIADLNNAVAGLPISCRCVASACIAWQTAHVDGNDVAHGFCGLVGE